MNICLKISFCLWFIQSSSTPLVYSLEENSNSDIFLFRSELKDILNEKNLNSVDSCSTILSKKLDNFLQNESLENNGNDIYLPGYTKFCVEKVFERFFSKPETKIDISPIINLLTIILNQSNVTEQCQMQVISFLNATANINDKLQNLTSDDLWPLYVFDSIGKDPSGVLQGNFRSVGDYYQCTNIKRTEWKGKYCSLETTDGNLMSIFSKFFGSIYKVPFTRGLCVPDKCNQIDVTAIINIIRALVLNSNLTTSYIDVKCPSDFPYEKSLDTKAIVTIVILSIIIGFVLIATIYELFYLAKEYLEKNRDYLRSNSIFFKVLIRGTFSKQKELIQEKIIKKKADSPVAKLLLGMSIYGNFKRLTNVDRIQGQLDCLNGIRFLSMGWVVLGHLFLDIWIFYFGYSFVIENLGIIDLWSKRESGKLITRAPYAVDSFFLISGLLTTFLFLKEMKKNSKYLNLFDYVIIVFKFYLHRFLRITPVYMIALMITATLPSYFSSGPNKLKNGVPLLNDRCDENWWYNFLYVNNLFNYPNEKAATCLEQSWYLGADMQFHWIAPIILIPMASKKALVRFVGVCLAFLFWGAQIITTAAILKEHPGSEKGSDELYDRYIQYKTWCRGAPFFAGMLLGFLLINHKRKLLIELNIFLWSVALLFIGSMMFVDISAIFGFPSNVSAEWRIVYESTKWSVWSLGLGYVIYACCNSQGFLVDWFLSLKIWMPLSRITFSAYLLHELVIRAYIQGLFKMLYIQESNFATLYISMLFLVCSVAFIYSLIIEMPFLAMDKFLMGFLSKSHNSNRIKSNNEMIIIEKNFRNKELIKI